MYNTKIFVECFWNFSKSHLNLESMWSEYVLFIYVVGSDAADTED